MHELIFALHMFGALSIFMLITYGIITIITKAKKSIKRLSVILATYQSITGLALIVINPSSAAITRLCISGGLYLSALWLIHSLTEKRIQHTV